MPAGRSPRPKTSESEPGNTIGEPGNGPGLAGSTTQGTQSPPSGGGNRRNRAPDPRYRTPGALPSGPRTPATGTDFPIPRVSHEARRAPHEGPEALHEGPRAPHEGSQANGRGRRVLRASSLLPTKTERQGRTPEFVPTGSANFRLAVTARHPSHWRTRRSGWRGSDRMEPDGDLGSRRVRRVFCCPATPERPTGTNSGTLQTSALAFSSPSPDRYGSVSRKLRMVSKCRSSF